MVILPPCGDRGFPVIIIDTSVWIPIINRTENPEAKIGRELILRSEDIGIPGIILDEVLRGFRDDRQYRVVRQYLLDDFEYLDITRDTFLFSADIFRTMRKEGVTLKNPVDCLIAASALENGAMLLENDHDFKLIARHFPLRLVTDERSLGDRLGS